MRGSFVRAAVIYGAGDVRVEHLPDPVIKEPTDALVRVVRACVCGSDLHPYHSKPASERASTIGHEFVGVVEETGSQVTTLSMGDFVIAPFAISDNTCDFCREGLHTACRAGRVLELGRRRRRAGRGGARPAGRRHPGQGRRR